MPSSPPRILLLDDDADVRRTFTRAFEREGWEVTATGSAEVALDRMAARLGPGFDLFVLDIFLGGLTSGLQVARKACELQPDAGIVVVSSLLRPGSPEARLPTDRVEFLSKPVDLVELLAVARRLARAEAG